jgi:murein DD-endopeptidase MepM/ murein hydrolase activator NlpD
MYQPEEPFNPQRPIDRLRLLAEELFHRYLTPLSIGVAVIGVVVVLAGPVRGLLLGGRGGSPGGGGRSIADGLAELAGGGSADNLINVASVDRGLVPYTIIPDRPRDAVEVYTVKTGDTLFGIANQFGITPEVLFWANSESLGDNLHYLTPGMDLYILPVEGVYHFSDGVLTIRQIADRYQANVEDVLSSPYNELDEYTADDVPPWGMHIVVPGGQREIVDWPPAIVAVVDEVTGVVTQGFMPGMGGSCPSGIAGSGGSGVWARPVGDYTVTTPFTTGHSGVDLAAPLGTPVTASDSGVVIFSGWNDYGYGILVVLDHGNGWTTYYAHLSSTAVGCGQYVSRGGLVGQIGSTGRSSGPHVHFEMRWNHTPDNPASYIGF